MEIKIERSRLAVIVGFIAVVLVAGVVVVSTHSSAGDGASASSSTTTAPDTVSVSGTGSVTGVPDTLIAQFRIHTKQPTVQQALNQSSTDTHLVSSKLHSLGVALVDIKSTNLSLNPDYDMHGNIDGYDASESLTVRIHPLTKVGQILSAAATAPADNSVSVEGLSFDIADNSSLLAQARTAAFDNAKAAAAQYADLGGRSLARVMTVKAVVHNPTPVYASNGFAAATRATPDALKAVVPIRPGQKKVSVTVSVVWALS